MKAATAFGRRCIPAGCVAPPSNMAGYSRSSRLARGAPRRPRCSPLLSPRAAGRSPAARGAGCARKAARLRLAEGRLLRSRRAGCRRTALRERPRCAPLTFLLADRRVGSARESERPSGRRPALRRSRPSPRRGTLGEGPRCAAPPSRCRSVITSATGRLRRTVRAPRATRAGSPSARSRVRRPRVRLRAGPPRHSP